MSHDTAKDHYQAERGRAYHGVKRGVPAIAYDWIARLRAEKFSSNVSSHDDVLEYGVGSGWNLAALNCKRRVGYDVSEFLEQAVRGQNIEFVSTTSRFADSSFDVVICHHTLEHVFHPVETLREIKRLLKARGKLLLFVPYEKESRYRRFDPAEPNHHLFSWNVQTLGNLVSEVGFEIRSGEIGEFGYDRFSATKAVKLKLGETGFRAIRRLGHLVRPAKEVRVVAIKPERP